MPSKCEISDATAATEAWEDYREDWTATLSKAKQEKPTPEQVASLREIFVEAFILGRLSK